MRKLLGLLPLCLLIGATLPSPNSFDSIANEYLVLAVGAHQLDAEMVTITAASPSVVQQAKAAKRDKAAIAESATALMARLDALPQPVSRMEMMRRRHLRAFLNSLRAQMSPAGHADVDRQVSDIFGFTPKYEPLASFDPAIDRLDRRLPGSGSIGDRIGELKKTSIIPKERIPAVFAAAVAECRRRTVQHIQLPPEHVEIRYIPEPTFPGANDYKGDGKSTATISTDYPQSVDQLLILACHEVYPGHHVHFLTLDELRKKRQWPELGVDFTASPTVPVAEGVAETAIGIAFSAAQRLAFERDRLYPLAGLRLERPEQWLAFWAARPAVLGATSTVARDYLSGKINAEQAKSMFMRYRLQDDRAATQMLKVISAVGPYVIASDLGWQATDRIMRGKSRSEQWRLLHKIESEPMLLADVEALARK